MNGHETTDHGFDALSDEEREVVGEPSDYDWDGAFTPPPLRMRFDPECDYCRSHRHLRWMPWHEPSADCTSELRQHCTCQSCRNTTRGVS